LRVPLSADAFPGRDRNPEKIIVNAHTHAMDVAKSFFDIVIFFWV
jgi:hypothetical protein